MDRCVICDADYEPCGGKVCNYGCFSCLDDCSSCGRTWCCQCSKGVIGNDVWTCPDGQCKI